MAEVRLIKKQLAGTQDLLLGVGTVTQQRATGEKVITKINVTELQGAMVVDTLADLYNIDPTQLGATKTVIVNEDGTIRKYDAVNSRWEIINPGETSGTSDTSVQIGTVADFRAMTTTPKVVYVSGYHTVDDGTFGETFFRLREGAIPDGTFDNGGTVIETVNGVYDLQFSGAVNVKWFGGSISNSLFDTYDFIDLNNSTITTDYNSRTVYYINGKVLTTSGEPNPSFRIKLGTTDLVTNLKSYIGFINDGFSDSATRMYILPKDKVTSGAGGALKIFGDAYHLGQDYRDLGIYFYANQSNDTGTHGTGVFWINSKVSGVYSDKNPDIGFSFQDGTFIGGRFSLLHDPYGNTYSTLIIGSSKALVADQSHVVKMEVQGDMAFANPSDGIRWLSYNNALDSKLEFIADGYIVTIGGDEKWKIDETMVGFKGVNGTFDSGIQNNSFGGVSIYSNSNKSLEIDDGRATFEVYESYNIEVIDASSITSGDIAFSTNKPLKYINNLNANSSFNIVTSNIPQLSKVYIFNTSSAYNLTINSVGSTKTIPPLKIGEFLWTGSSFVEIV